jgi:hypothetical protein
VKLRRSKGKFEVLSSRHCDHPQRSAAPSKEPEADSLNYAANLKAYANETAGGGDPGSGGHEKRSASPAILSDPQRPHRCHAEEEIILQFSQ